MVWAKLRKPFFQRRKHVWTSKNVLDVQTFLRGDESVTTGRSFCMRLLTKLTDWLTDGLTGDQVFIPNNPVSRRRTQNPKPETATSVQKDFDWKFRCWTLAGDSRSRIRPEMLNSSNNFKINFDFWISVLPWGGVYVEMCWGWPPPPLRNQKPTSRKCFPLPCIFHCVCQKYIRNWNFLQTYY